MVIIRVKGTTKRPGWIPPTFTSSAFETAFVKVFIPAQDCAWVETKPVDPVPAIGMFNVWVDPEDEKAGTVPLYPKDKYWSGKNEFNNLMIKNWLSLSPDIIGGCCRVGYNNIKKMDYPHILITTSLSDNRVLFDEPAKFTAKLREYKTDNNLLLLKTEMNAGHGGKSGRDGAIEEIAIDYAFALKISKKI